MRSLNGSTRREFVRLGGLAAGMTGLGLTSTSKAVAGRQAEDHDPDAVLARLARHWAPQSLTTPKLHAAVTLRPEGGLPARLLPAPR